MKADELEKCLGLDRWVLQEKVNGERCIVSVHKADVTARNRQGRRLDAAPAASHALSRIGCDATFDGERGVGRVEGNYSIFDFLEMNGESLRAQPFAVRFRLLVETLAQAGLIGQIGPTIQRNTPVVPGLYVLSPAIGEQAKRRALAEIKQGGGEGVVLRSLTGPSMAGDTRHERKFKFRSEIDCIVLGLKPGGSAGSVRLGLIRPADGRIIEVGSVRAGLTDDDVRRVGGRLAAGARPIITVEFLPVRTTGIRLAEPTTSPSSLRTDKTPAECTTDQLVDLLGEDRTGEVSRAIPFAAF